jgi:hypothetical protein
MLEGFGRALDEDNREVIDEARKINRCFVTRRQIPQIPPYKDLLPSIQLRSGGGKGTRNH